MDTLSKYEQLVYEMFIQNNLINWKLVWNNKTSNATFGICKYKTKEIHLNKKVSLILKEDEVIDTIIHEIAHALTPGHSHDEVWKEKCRVLGCRDERYANIEDYVLNKLAKYKGVCPTCGHVIYSGRKTGIIHVQCSNKDYEKSGKSNFEKHTYNWSKNE